jgi:glucose/mannose transport system permease protein
MKGHFQQKLLIAAALTPTVLVAVYFIWGFGAATAYLSFTDSSFLPSKKLIGLFHYQKLFSSARWWNTYGNMFIYGGVYLFGCLSIGIVIAAMLDRLPKSAIIYRTIYLYPLALSLVITGLAWQWVLSPTTGLQHLIRELGFESFSFNILGSSEYAIYALGGAAVWHSTGLVIVLFLSGMKGIDVDLWRSAQIDRIPTWRVYASIVLPQLRSTLMTAIVLLAFNVVRSFDIVVALTKGGPGRASELPALYAYEFYFVRGNIGQGSAAAVVMVVSIMAIVLPYLIYELRKQKQ